MRLYETVFILKPDLTEEENQNAIQRIVQVIEQNKGELVRLDEWGIKTLAYKVRKFSKGYYVYAVFLGDNPCVNELDRHFKMLDPFMRHIIVKLDDRELEHHRKAQSDKAAEKEATPEREAASEKEAPAGDAPAEEVPPESPAEPESQTTEEVPA